MSRIFRASMAAVAACTVLACSDNPSSVEQKPLVASIHIGDGQTAAVAQSVAIPPTVRVMRDGATVSGTAVTFAVATGGGTVTAATATTDASGLAHVGQWTLGTTAGAQSLTATVTGATGSPITFNATALPGSPATVTKQGGDLQTAVAGAPVAARPSVKVTDQFGNAVAGVAVSFAVTAGAGSVAGGNATTGVDGVATLVGWTLGPAIGTNTLTVTAQGTGITGNPATFSATAIAGAAAFIVKQGGDAQSATVGTAITTRPSVKVTDQFGNLVPGATVTFAVASGNGTLTSAAPATGADGIATVGSWTLGTTSGAQSITATVGGAGVTGNPVTFTATANPGAASAVVKVAGDGVSSVVAAPALPRPTIKVTDQYGNGIPNVAVTFAVTAGTGTLQATQQVTGADGTASVGNWTIGQLVGMNVLRATAALPGLTGNPADFTVTGIPGPAAIFVKFQGDIQNIVAGTAVPIPPTVKITDQYGNNVVGATVNFAIVGGGGAITGATPATGGAGTASIGSWTFGATPGTNTLTASMGTFNLTFTGTGLAQLSAAQYTGTYAGTWTNTTFGSTGTATVTIADNAGSSNANITISATGNVLGVPGGIPSTARVTTYNTLTGAYSGNIPQLGNVTMNVSSTLTPGLLSIAAFGEPPFPGGGIIRWDAIGTIVPTQISFTFTVTFTSGPPATGNMTLLRN